jgi:hypothetical protein
VHQAKPAQLAASIRRHWHIENKIHWVRDVTYDEDRSQIRTGTGPQVVAPLSRYTSDTLMPGTVTAAGPSTSHEAARQLDEPRS